MNDSNRRWLGVAALFVLAPAVAMILIMTLLLLGVDPHTVFLPGHFVRSHFHVSNSVGVVTTGVAWWAVVVAVWLVVRRIVRGSRVR